MAKASAGKTPWFDEASEAPLLAEYARKLDSFLDVVADGRVDAKEVEAQEHRALSVRHLFGRKIAPNCRCALRHLETSTLFPAPPGAFNRANG